MLKQYLKRIIKEVLEKDGIESLKIGKHTAYVRNDKVHVSAATPKIQLQGTEISAMNLSLRENAGAIELYDETAAVVRASWSGTTGQRITPLIADTEIADGAVTDAKILDPKVSKAGDTMTGTLNLKSGGGTVLDAKIGNLINVNLIRLGSVFMIFASNGGTDRVAINGTNVLFPVQATTANKPAYVIGGLYFDLTLKKLRVGGELDWETVTSA